MISKPRAAPALVTGLMLAAYLVPAAAVAQTPPPTT